MLHISEALVPFLSQVHLLEWQGTSLLLAQLEAFFIVLQYPLFEIVFLESNEHPAFFKTMRFLRLAMDGIKSCEIGLLENVLNVFVDQLVECIIAFIQLIDVSFDLLEVLLS